MSTIRFASALGLGVALIPPSASRAAWAAEIPTSFNTPPRGAGTEQIGPRGTRIREGIEGSVGIGTGFSDTYGVATEARAGYVFHDGLYAGGAVQYYVGHSVNDESAHATFFGGELGYKFFAGPRIEVRPYVFGGPAFITQVQSDPFRKGSNTSFALQPSALVAYHIGEAFFGGDARWLVTPTPNTVAILASGGLGF